MPDDLHATVAALLDRVARLEAEVGELRGEQKAAVGPDERLAGVIFAAIGDQWTTSRELWRLAETERLAAETSGEALPDLARGLANAEIRNAYALGRSLSRMADADLVNRGSEERDGVLWQIVSPGAVSPKSKPLTP